MEPPRIEVIDRVFAAVLATKTPADRAWMIGDCHRSARVILAAGERTRHPDWPEELIALTVAKRLLDGTN